MRRWTSRAPQEGHLLVKNNENSASSYKTGIDQIDCHVPEKHIWADLERRLGILQD